MTGTPARRQRILSGVQPTGSLHLGNYFGAIRQHIALQAEGECYFFIANYHALTTVRDAAALRAQTLDVAVTYLALGLDPTRTVFYRQSDVPEVTELTWLLCAVTSMGLLERAHSYKEKVAKGITPGVGLFAYPVLMAADILAPRADLVPVGQDQDQHVEMARDMAEAFHAAFGKEVFALPKAKLSPAARVTGTTFEKGAVLQVNVSLRVDAGFDTDGYVEGMRRLVGELLASAGPDAHKTTEELEAALGAAHAHRWMGLEVVARTLRTVAEMPTSGVVTSREAGVTTLEFYVPMDRVVFVTRQGKRQAAKMSKSYGNTIPIFAEGKALKKTVMGIETRLVDLQDPLDPDEDLVMGLYRLFASEAEVAEMAGKYRAGGYGFGRSKTALLEKIEAHFAPFRARRAELLADAGYVEDVLVAGAKKARAVARETLDAARAACGL